MIEWILGVIEEGGYLGVFGLMLLENLFPPIPSELIMPLAGFHAARGTFELAPTLAAGVLGSVVGALPWYYGPRMIGRQGLDRFLDRYGVILTVDAADLARAETWFQRRGWLAVLLGRMFPGIRTVISAPAGLFRMPLAPFLALTTIGSFGWVALLTGAGYVLEAEYDRVEGWIDPVAKLILATGVAVYLWRLVAKLRARAAG